MSAHEARIAAVLGRIHARNPDLAAFTRVLDDAALQDARALDVAIARGETPGPLAGVPFAVKDLFDVAGLITTAGAHMRLAAPPASRDAEAVARLKAAGAILVGTLNMDEYAYGFATVNAHFGTTRNPHDLTRLAGGSSGGSAAAVAGGLVPLTLGSDTNGSIRVPASLCGVWGYRPAQTGSGVLPLDGVFPFVEELDTIGPFASDLATLQAAFEVLSGWRLATDDGVARVARLTGFFEHGAAPEALAAVDAVMAGAGAADRLVLPGAETARSAAFLITAARGGALHLATLKDRAMDYDPAVRDRLLAGAMLPGALVFRALDYAKAWRAAVMNALKTHDVLVAPATPCAAPRIDDATILIDGKPVSARANLGIYAQAIGLAGPAMICAPVTTDTLPIGVQLIAAPGQEAKLFAFARRLEAQGVLGGRIA